MIVHGGLVDEVYHRTDTVLQGWKRDANARCPPPQSALFLEELPLDMLHIFYDSETV